MGYVSWALSNLNNPADFLQHKGKEKKKADVKFRVYWFYEEEP